MTVALLEVDDLSVELPTARGPLRALTGVSLRLEQGSALGVVGAGHGVVEEDEKAVAEEALERALIGED